MQGMSSLFWNIIKLPAIFVMQVRHTHQIGSSRNQMHWCGVTPDWCGPCSKNIIWFSNCSTKSQLIPSIQTQSLSMPLRLAHWRFAARNCCNPCFHKQLSSVWAGFSVSSSVTQLTAFVDTSVFPSIAVLLLYTAHAITGVSRCCSLSSTFFLSCVRFEWIFYWLRCDLPMYTSCNNFSFWIQISMR